MSLWPLLPLPTEEGWLQRHKEQARLEAAGDFPCKGLNLILSILSPVLHEVKLSVASPDSHMDIRVAKTGSSLLLACNSVSMETLLWVCGLQPQPRESWHCLCNCCWVCVVNREVVIPAV